MIKTSWVGQSPQEAHETLKAARKEEATAERQSKVDLSQRLADARRQATRYENQLKQMAEDLAEARATILRQQAELRLFEEGRKGARRLLDESLVRRLTEVGEDFAKNYRQVFERTRRAKAAGQDSGKLQAQRQAIVDRFTARLRDAIVGQQTE